MWSWFTKKEKKEKKYWNTIVEPVDSSGYYWRHAQPNKWRLWSPKSEYVGTALEECGCLDFYVAPRLTKPTWTFDAEKPNWKTKIIVKILALDASRNDDKQ